MLASFFVAGLLALRATAFLVVPETFDINRIDAVDAQKLSLELKCNDCPFARSDRPDKLDGFDSTLGLTFSTESDKLLVNDVQIFPPPSRFIPPETILHRKSDNLASRPIPFGYIVEVSAPELDEDESGAKLLVVHFSVVDVGGVAVPVDTVHLHLIKIKNGPLLLVKDKVETSPTCKFSWRQCGSRPKCYKNLLIARIRSLIAAARARAAAAANKLPFKGCRGKHHAYGGHHHHQHSQFAHAFAHALRSFVIPAVLGLCAGVTACALGMLIGHGIAALWIRYRLRQSPRGRPDQESGDDSEKEALMEGEEDLPPRYEDTEHGQITLPAEKE
ncbi:hypothetical protein VTO42DRAFT_6812 [Malbranchea cinnamomea]